MLNTTLCNQFAKKLAGKFCALTLPLLLLFANTLVFSNNILSQTANNPEQGANGSALAPHAVTFQNGNLHSGNAHFLEGHSIPYHLVMTGLTPGAQYIIKIGMDALESGAAAIDYVTSIHNLTPHTFFGHPAELINPLEGTGFTEGSFGGAGNIQTIPLPAPVHSPPAVGINTFFGAGTWNNLAAEKKSILLFGASAFGSVWYDAGLFDYTLINTGNVTKPIYLTIHFTAATANAVLAWGGHIASQLDYGLNTTAATEVNGAPYHTRRSGMWNGDSTVIYANEGADRSLQIDAITVCVVTAGEIGGSQTVCSGGDPALLTIVQSAQATGVLTYQWLSSATGCSGPWSAITGATDSTYNPPAGITATTYYKRVAYSDAECNDTSNCVTVTVNTVTAGEIAASQTICSGGDPAAFTQTVAATGSGTPTYQWQSKLGNCTGAFSNISGATSATYDAPAGLTATTSYRRIVTFTFNGVECKDTSNCVTVTVNSVTAGTIAASQTICSGDDPAAFTESVAATGDGTPTYQWQSKLGNCTGAFSDIVGATSATYDAPALTATTSFRRIVTFTLSGVECKDTSNCVTITVNTVTAGTIAASQTICSGDDPAAFTESVAATGDGTPTYQWQSKLGNCTGAFSDIVGATSATYDAPALTATTSFRRIVTFTLSGVECKDTSNCVTITVNTVTAGTIAANQTICSGDDPAAFTETVAATGDGTPTYQWQSKLGNCTGVFSDIVGATSATYDAPALTATTSFRRIVTFTLSGVECKDTSNCVTITVNTVTAGTIAASQTICSGDDPAAFTESVAATGDGTPTYQWQSKLGNCTGAFSNIVGATSATYDAPALTATTSFRRIVTFTLSGVECKDTSNCVTITVNTVTAGTIAASQTICSGGDPAAFTESVAATGDGTPTYQWQSKLGNCTGAFSNIVGATSATYDAPAGLTATTSYRRIVTFTLSGVECKDTSNCVTVTVNTVTAGTIAANQTICTGEDPAAFTETVAATGDGTPTYQWQSKLGNCTGVFADISGATSATYDAPALNATTSFRRIVTFTLSGVECKDTSNCVTVTVQDCLDHIFPTGTTCDNFEAQDVPPLLSLCFKQSEGVVTNASSPGAWFYFFYVTKPAGVTKITVQVTQSNDNVIQGLFTTSEIKAWTSGTCNQITQNVTTSFANPSSPVITIDGLSNSEQLIVISVKYNSNSIVGSTVTGNSSVYTFGALYGTGNNPPVNPVPGSGETLTAVNCSQNTIVTARDIRDLLTEANQSDLKITAFPNPFNRSVYFNFVSPVSGRASLDVYDVLGRRLATVFQGHVDAGVQKSVNYTVPSAHRVPMVYRLTVGDKTSYGKLLPGSTE